MCRREGASLQRGMNFRIGKTHSVILMSVRPNAPYSDRFEDSGTAIVYEGHDMPKTAEVSDPKTVDQQTETTSGKLTQNGRFHLSAQDSKLGKQVAERVRVYEKIKQGIWSYNGLFHLVDSWRETSRGRSVFKFRLVAVEEDTSGDSPTAIKTQTGRVIPTRVKLEVWKRDGGKCIKCGASENLHFDHIIPYSKGGSSETSENIQLLCASHNLEKRDHIE
jgi:hypothetical protein